MQHALKVKNLKLKNSRLSVGRMDLDVPGDLHVLVRCCMWVVLDVVIIAAIVSSVAVGACNS